MTYRPTDVELREAYSLLFDEADRADAEQQYPSAYQEVARRLRRVADWLEGQAGKQEDS